MQKLLTCLTIAALTALVSVQAADKSNNTKAASTSQSKTSCTTSQAACSTSAAGGSCCASSAKVAKKYVEVKGAELLAHR